MKRKKGKSLWEVFGDVDDGRDPSGKRFGLQTILSIIFCAIACGRTSLAAIARWGRSLSPSQLTRLGICKGRAPCHSTYHHALKKLDPSKLVSQLGKLVRSYSGRKRALKFRHTALDGKALRGSKNGDYPGLLVLSAFLAELDGVIAQEVVPFKKGNEATHAIKLLERIPLKGRVITGDAALTQREFCQKILDGGGQYLLAVKDNQPGLKNHIALVFGPSLFPRSRSHQGPRDQVCASGRKGARSNRKSPS